MKKRAPVCAGLILLFSMNSFALDNGYVNVSLVNLRDKPSLQGSVITQLTIGTAVNGISREKDGWCLVSVPEMKLKGYTLSNYISKIKPTLETIAREISNTTNRKDLINLYERKYYLSPSLYTLREFYWNFSQEPALSNLIQKQPAQLNGKDFRPVISNWNSAVSTNRNIVLKKTSKSLFKNKNDAFLVTAYPFIREWIDEDEAAQTNRRKKEGVRYRTDKIGINTLVMLEYIKLLKNVEYGLEKTPPFYGYDGMEHVFGVGAWVFHFEKGPITYFLTSKGLAEAALDEVKNVLNEPLCSYDFSYARYSVQKPVQGQILAVVMLPKKLDSSRYKVLSLDNKQWYVDLNGDSVPDVAAIYSDRPSEVSEGSTLMTCSLFINIGGKWFLAGTFEEPDCT